MNDETKAAWERLWKIGEESNATRYVQTDDLSAVLYWLDGEPARLAAAREEQRRACAEIPQHIAHDDSQWQALHEYIMGCPLTSTTLADRIKALEAERDALRAQVEVERMRLAACGVVAGANTPESAARHRQMHADYRSASCDDVAATVDREMALRAQVEAARAEASKWPGQCGTFVLRAMDEAKP